MIMTPRLLSAVLLFVFLSSAHAHAQELTFQVQVSAADQVTQNCRFGLRETALAGLDSFDLPAPPPAPGSLLHGYLSMLTPPPGLPNQWLSDFRPLESMNLDLVEIWTFRLEHESIATEALMHVTEESPLPAQYELWLHQSDGTSQLVAVPSFLEISLDYSPMEFMWELRMDGSVASGPISLGGLKATFR